jgi:hypothetical protein
MTSPNLLGESVAGEIRRQAFRTPAKRLTEHRVLFGDHVLPSKPRPDQSAGDDVKSERRGGTNLYRQSACPAPGQPTQACDSAAISLIKRRGEHQRKLSWSVPHCGGDRDEALQVEPTRGGICTFVNAHEAS